MRRAKLSPAVVALIEPYLIAEDRYRDAQKKRLKIGDGRPTKRRAAADDAMMAADKERVVLALYTIRRVGGVLRFHETSATSFELAVEKARFAEVVRALDGVISSPGHATTTIAGRVAIMYAVTRRQSG